MSNHARIINNIAIDVSPDPKNHFHPDIAAEFVPVPDAVVCGSVRDSDGNWQLPSSAISATTSPTSAPQGWLTRLSNLWRTPT